MSGSGLFSNQEPKKKHLVDGKHGVAGEVDDLREDVVRVLSGLVALTVDEFTNPATADVDAIKTSIASAATAQSYSGAALNGVVGTTEMVPPRNVTITTTLHADIDAVDVVITGKVRNADGILIDQVGTITLTNGGGTTDAGALAFSTVERIDVPAQSGVGGALTFGFGNLIGLGKPLISRAGLVAVLHEIAVGAVVTNGTFVNAATSAPNGTYSPNAAPNGANDYAVYYEYDPAA